MSTNCTPRLQGYSLASRWGKPCQAFLGFMVRYVNPSSYLHQLRAPVRCSTTSSAQAWGMQGWPTSKATECSLTALHTALQACAPPAVFQGNAGLDSTFSHRDW